MEFKIGDKIFIKEVEVKRISMKLNIPEEKVINDILEIISIEPNSKYNIANTKIRGSILNLKVFLNVYRLATESENKTDALRHLFKS